MKKIATLFIVVLAVLFSIKSNSQSSVYWSEDFEGNWTSNWSANSGVWEIDSPQYIPNYAHSGTYCAGTGMQSNYPTYADVQLTKYTWLTIPPAWQNPRLRFWQWLQFYHNYPIPSGDYGYVEVKTQTGVWTPLSSYQFYGLGSSTWTVQELDLTSWADSTIQIGFHFISDYSTFTVSAGWFIDDIEIRTGPYCFTNPEGFENGYGDWAVDMGTWRIGAPTWGPGSCHTGLNCAGTQLDGDYDRELATGLRTTWIHLPLTNSYANFWHWYSFAGGDYGEIYILTKDTYYLAAPQISGFSNNNWTFYHLDLIGFEDSLIQLDFYFVSDYSSFTVSSGWYIDDLDISGQSSLSCVTGIKESILPNNKINISPNPTSGIFKITFANQINNGIVEILNPLGQRLFEEKIINESQKEIYLKNIESGVYFVKVRDGENYFIKKLTVY